MRRVVFEVVFANGLWVIVPVDGALANRVVARAECLTMGDVTFSGTQIIGGIIGVWGAKVEDVAYDDTPTIMSLGISGPIGTARAEQLAIQDNTYVRKSTGEPLTCARVVTMYRGSVFAAAY